MIYKTQLSYEVSFEETLVSLLGVDDQINPVMNGFPRSYLT